VRELDRSRYAGAEADAVIGAIDIVVHRLWNRDDVHSFIVQSLAVAECVVPSDWNEDIDPDLLEIPENVFRDVVDGLLISTEVRWNSRPRQMTWTGSGCVKECPTCAAGAIHDRFGQLLDVLGIVDAFIAVEVDESRPSTSYADDSVSFAKRANGDCSDCGIEAWDVAAPGENPNRSLVACHARKVALPVTSSQITEPPFAFGREG